MSALRQDLFLKSLKALKDEYKEYTPVLNCLIEKIEQGQHDQIQHKIRQLQKSSW